jgi:hypothetical protein
MTRVESIVGACLDDIGGADSCVYVTPVWFMDTIEVKAVSLRGVAYEHLDFARMAYMTEPEVCLALLDACERTARTVLPGTVAAESDVDK